MNSTESDKRKQSMYLPAKMLEDIQAEASRLDRSMSWLMQQAWRIAEKEIASYQSFADK